MGPASGSVRDLMGRTRLLSICLALLGVIALLGVGAVDEAGARTSHWPAKLPSLHGIPPHGGSAYAAPRPGTFAPRAASALGLIPARNRAASPLPPVIPVVYHGGPVMRTVHLHTVFWAPTGFRFSGAPSAGVPGYTNLVQQFTADAAAASGRTDNAFALLHEFGDGSGAGASAMSYDPARDSVTDTAPYPTAARACASPAGIVACLSDRQIQLELARVIRARDPSGTGLHDLWMVFLPPDVDTCVTATACATNAYAGYHSLFSTGGQAVVYAVMPDPLVEQNPPAGSDPQGNPEAESVLDVVAHEVVEAISDPMGNGWMDPNGFEVGDKCEVGPQDGTPLGHAANGAPYNQLLAGHEYLVQTMWSNRDSGCRQSSTVAGTTAGLPTVAMTQYSATLSGATGIAASIPVEAGLVRGDQVVGIGVGQTDARGRWQVELDSPIGAPMAVGDDRDAILVEYGKGGPPDQLILTGDGGNPFTASGWTGWFDLDHGFAVGRGSVLVSPCSQVGSLALRIDGAAAGSPLLACAGNDSARVQSSRIRPNSRLTLTSTDNRASTSDAPYGALVTMTVTLGEPGAAAAVTNPLVPFPVGGIAACHADLRRQSVACQGLVPRRIYTLVRRRGGRRVRARADHLGEASFGPFGGRGQALRGGDVLGLVSATGRTVSTLHVAHLRLDLRGSSGFAVGGTCEPGVYVGPPVGEPPIGTGVGAQGVTGDGLVCPLDGRAAGMPLGSIVQPDADGPGQTGTEVPRISGTSPSEDATLYGPFVATAQSVLPVPGDGSTSYATGDRIALRVVRAGGHRAAFRAANVNRARGVAVAGLAPGAYTATWTLIDANGDTRTVRTQFVEESSLARDRGAHGAQP